MSMDKVQSTTDQINKFNGSKVSNAWRLAFDLLRQRPLLESDFFKIHGALTALQNGPGDKLFSSLCETKGTGEVSHPREHSLRYFCAYVAPYHPADGCGSSGMFIVTDRVHIEWRESFRCIRSLPLAFDVMRLERTHLRNSAHQVAYSSDDVIFAAMLAVPLARAYAYYLEPESYLPIVIPHSRGLFVGTVQKGNPAIPLNYGKSWLASRPSHRGTMKEVEGLSAGEGSPAVINITHSVGFSDFTPAKNQAYEILDPLRRDPEIVRGLQIGLDAVSWGPRAETAICESERIHLAKTWEKVRAAVDGAVWDKQGGKYFNPAAARRLIPLHPAVPAQS